MVRPDLSTTFCALVSTSVAWSTTSLTSGRSSVVSSPQVVRVLLADRHVEEPGLVNVHAGGVDEGDARPVADIFGDQVRDDRAPHAATQDQNIVPHRGHLTLRTMKCEKPSSARTSTSSCFAFATQAGMSVLEPSSLERTSNVWPTWPWRMAPMRFISGPGHAMPLASIVLSIATVLMS